MAIGSTNSSMNSKIEEDIKDLQTKDTELSNSISSLQTPTFTQASSRSNINSGESYTTIFGKIKKYFSDLKSHAFNNPVNNLTTTTTGYALDASQGKVLNDKINGLGNRWFSEVATDSNASRKIYADTAIINIEYDNKNSFGFVYERNSTINIIWVSNNLNLGYSSSSSGVTITSIPAWSRLCVMGMSGGNISVSST